MRGLPGSGKSTTVRDLMLKYGVTEDHVFGSDAWFHPVATRLKKFNSGDLNQKIELIRAIVDMWYGCKWSTTKDQNKDLFVHFKGLFDKGEIDEAIEAAKLMHDVIEKVEYTGNWDGEKLRKAHGDTLTRLKKAIDQGLTPVILDNTNVTIGQPKTAAAYAIKAGYEIKIQEPTSPHWQQHRDLFANKQYGKNKAKLDDFAHLLANKNQHGVPYDTIKTMMDKWQHNITPKDVKEHVERFPE